MASKKKILTSAVALGTAAALTLGGTFAWQSLNQTAVNEASNIVNPGGRLHDDFDGTNKDIYVENFADEAIFARVRLEEYFEVVMNLGVEGMETTETLIGDKTTTTNDDGTSTTKYTYVPFDFKDHVHDDGTVSAANIENLDTKPSMAAKADTENDAGLETQADEDETAKNLTSYWQWTTGSDKSEKAYYMPTFNKNQDSLIADTNGAYNAELGAIIARSDSQYKDYTTYTETSTKSAYEVYDGDYDTVDDVNVADLKDLMANGKDAANYETTLKGHVLLSSEKIAHTAKEIGESKGLISLTEWLALNDGEYTAETHGGYWVYDDSVDKDGKATGNGWVYWSSPIEAGKTTGRLLDSIKLDQKMDDSWYYAINVVGQFITADDLGEEGIKGEDDTVTGGTGFYADSGTITDNAMKLLTAIGVENPDKTPVLKLTAESTDSSTPVISAKDSGVNTWKVIDTDDSKPGSIDFIVPSLTEGEDYTYEDGILTILTTKFADHGARLMFNSGDTYHYGYILWQDDGALTLNADNQDGTVVEIGKGVTLKLKDGGTPAASDVKIYPYAGSTGYELSSDKYTYEDGVLTLTDVAVTDGPIMIKYKNNDSLKSWLYIKEADNSTPPTDESLAVSLTSSPEGTKTTTNDDGNTVYYCMSDKTGEDAVYQFSTNAAAGSTVTWKIDKSYDGSDFAVQEPDESGVQKVTDWTGEDTCVQLDTKTGKLTFDKTVLETPVDLILTATASKTGGADETVTFEVSQLPELSLTVYDTEQSQVTNQTSATLSAGDEIKVIVTSSTNGLFGGSTYATHYELMDGSCASIVLGDNSNRYTTNTISRSSTVSCDKTTSTVRAWVEICKDGASVRELPWFCVDFTVNCGQADSNGGTDASPGGTGDDNNNTVNVADWSSKVTMRNLTNDEYDLLCDVTSEDNDLMHWENMMSITSLYEDDYVYMRGFTGARDELKQYLDGYGQAYGFRPAFAVKNADDYKNLKAGYVGVMGTLYVGSDAVKVPAEPVNDGDISAYGASNTAKITLGKALEDTDYQMKAIYIGDGVFVCDRVMLDTISYNYITAALS